MTSIAKTQFIEITLGHARALQTSAITNWFTYAREVRAFLTANPDVLVKNLAYWTAEATKNLGDSPLADFMPKDINRYLQAVDHLEFLGERLDKNPEILAAEQSIRPLCDLFAAAAVRKAGKPYVDAAVDLVKTKGRITRAMVAELKSDFGIVKMAQRGATKSPVNNESGVPVAPQSEGGSTSPRTPAPAPTPEFPDFVQQWVRSASVEQIEWLMDLAAKREMELDKAAGVA